MRPYDGKVLSFEICAHKKGSSIGELRNFKAHYLAVPDGILAIIAHLF